MCQADALIAQFSVVGVLTGVALEGVEAKCEAAPLLCQMACRLSDSLKVGPDCHWKDQRFVAWRGIDLDEGVSARGSSATGITAFASRDSSDSAMQAANVSHSL